MHTHPNTRDRLRLEFEAVAAVYEDAQACRRVAREAEWHRSLRLLALAAWILVGQVWALRLWGFDPFWFVLACGSTESFCVGRSFGLFVLMVHTDRAYSRQQDAWLARLRHLAAAIEAQAA